MINKNTFRTLFILLMLISASCSTKSNNIDNNTAQNPNSPLILLLLRYDDFPPTDWKLQYTEIMQKYVGGNGLEETASYWVVSRHLPNNEYFRISHHLFLYEESESVQQKSPFQFQFTPEVVIELPFSQVVVETARCAMSSNMEYKECIIRKNYGRLVSILDVNISSKISDVDLVMILTPLLLTIDERINTDFSQILK
ncbi:MAG: hypothetical protein HFACDABA_02350 [Anaerolineales bacterium]|nr:hypothetical protein [Anaerolineales bacterium]